VKNDSFNRDLSGWTLGSGEWVLDELTHSGVAKVINQPYRYRGPGVDSYSVGIWQCVKIDRNQEYELRFRGRMSGDFAKIGYGAAELTWFPNSTCSIHPKRLNGGIVGFPVSVKLTVSDGKWHEISLASGHPPRAAQSVEIMLQSVATDLQANTPIEVWFDDIVFRSVNK